MNTAIQCIVLLACVVICSSTSIKRCQCVNTKKQMDPKLIADVKVYKPRPYCSKTEVIVSLKDNNLMCLDPEDRFTKTILIVMKMQKARRAAKMNNTVPNTITAEATTPNTIAPVS
ncbi:interleukin-8-like [Seriola aureovittata]|uniref:interleukin-8-like n=1 Tax=Seriola aureovittata TaxID=2871759 RepID=UPI0024BE36FA|nr:interleukin-8-like [Seriola aureovittata]